MLIDWTFYLAAVLIWAIAFWAVRPDPLALLRSRSYVALLVLAAVIGVPVSAVATQRSRR